MPDMARGRHVTPFEFANRRGEVIRGVFQEGCASGPRPLVVMSTAFGQTFRRYLPAAAYFTRNGYDVVRYDMTNHEGLSDGETVDMRLSWMSEDLADVVDACAGVGRWSSIAVFAASLGARVAMRVAADPRISALGMVSAVVDTRATMAAANGVDWFEVFYAGGCGGDPDFVGDTYGGPVKARCVADAVANGWEDVGGTVRDLDSISAPVLAVAGARDEWVDLTTVRAVFAPRPNAQLVVLDDSGHELAWRDAPSVMAAMVAWFGRVLDRGPCAEGDVVPPGIAALTRQNRTERRLESEWPQAAASLPSHASAGIAR